MPFDKWMQQYEEHGYALVPGLLSPEEIQQLRATTDALAAQAVGMSEENSVFDFEQGHTPAAPVIQRIKKPHRVDPLYMALAKHPKILGFVQRVIGENVRLSHTKINMKSARVGSPLEWHQDWAFAPHTNMSTCVASVMIDDASLENGAMQVVAGSHQGPLYEHHDGNQIFTGAMDSRRDAIDMNKTASLVGPAGTVAFHHPLTIHGSGANRSGAERRILFLEYAASDAWPLFYNVDWDEYNSRLVAGPMTSEVRTESNYIKLPFPTPAGSSIYKTQANARTRFFEPVSQS